VLLPEQSQRELDQVLHRQYRDLPGVGQVYKLKETLSGTLGSPLAFSRPAGSLQQAE